MLSSLIIAAILTAAAAFLAWPLVGNIFLGLPEPMLGSGTALDIIPGCASWWSSLCWTDHFQPMGLITLAGLLPTFGAIAQSAGDRRAEDGGPLGNAKVVDNKRAVRKASDTWSGRGTPKGCGLVYGYSGGEFLYSSKTPHTITITASGGGKTVFLVLPTIYVCSSCGANLIVSDSKNELLALTGDGLESMGYNVVTLDLQNPRRGQRWNMLKAVVGYAEEGNVQDAETAAETIAQALIPDDGGDSHWSNSARGLLASAILTVAFSEECPREAKTITTVGRLINEGTEGTGSDPADRLKAFVRQLSPEHPARSFASQFLSLQHNELSSVLSTCKRCLRPYMSRDIAWLTSGDDIDVRRVLTEKTALFLRVLDEGSPYNALFAVFFDQLYREIDRICDQANGSLPRELVIVGDEWGNLPKVSCLPALTALGRSKRVSWNGIVQSISQLNKYGQDGRKKILANCGIKAAIKVLEREDQEFLSHQVGKTTRHAMSTGTSKAEQRITSSTSYGEMADFVIHEDEWKYRTASRDGIIVIKAAEEGAPAGHAGVFCAPVEWPSKTPARTAFNLGSKEHEDARKAEYYERLEARAEAHRTDPVPSWCPEWPDGADEGPAAPTGPQNAPETPIAGLDDEFSDYAEGLWP